MMEKKTLEIRRILNLRKDDGFYEGSEFLRGKLLKIHSYGTTSGGFHHVHGDLLDRKGIPIRFRGTVFHRIRLSKQRYNEKGEKI